MPQAPLRDGELYYEAHGSGFPLILISGLGGAAAAWRAQLEAFGRHFTTIIHDHRGTGRSTRRFAGEVTVANFAADVIDLMDALKIQKAHVVGHSTGGAIAQCLALDHPERIGRLGLVSTFARSDTYSRLGSEIRMMLLRQIGPEAYLRATPFLIYPNWWINANAAVIERYVENGLPSFPGVEIMSKKIAAIRSFDRFAELGRIPHETLVVCADNDILAPPYFSQDLARSIPKARLRIIEGAGHTCKQTKPDEFNSIVLDFLLQ